MNSRELATFIILGTVMAWMLASKSMRPHLLGIGAMFLEWKIATPLLLLTSNVVVATWLAHRAGFWTSDLVGATVLWFLFVGFVWLLGLGDAGKAGFIRQRLLEAIGVGAAIEVFLNLKTLPLPLELLLQVAMTCFVLIFLVASREERTKPVGTFFGALAALTVLGLTLYTVVSLIRDWRDLDKSLIRNEFIFPILLTFAVVPFIYLLALASGWELMTGRMRIGTDRRPPLRVIAGAISQLRGSLADTPYTTLPDVTCS